MFRMMSEMVKVSTVFTDMIRQGLTSYLYNGKPFQAEFMIACVSRGRIPSWKIEAINAGAFWQACLRQALDFHNYNLWEMYRIDATVIEQRVIVGTKDRVDPCDSSVHYFIIGEGEDTSNITYVLPSVEWIKVICDDKHL